MCYWTLAGPMRLWWVDPGLFNLRIVTWFCLLFHADQPIGLIFFVRGLPASSHLRLKWVVLFRGGLAENLYLEDGEWHLQIHFCVYSLLLFAFILPMLEYGFPVLGSAANSHLQLLDRPVLADSWLCPDQSLTNLNHSRYVAVLCIFVQSSDQSDALSV